MNFWASWGHLGASGGSHGPPSGGRTPPPGAPNRAINIIEIQQKQPLRSKPRSVKSVSQFRPSWGYLGGLWGISWASFGRPEPPPGAPNRVINLAEILQKHPLRSKPRFVKCVLNFQPSWGHLGASGGSHGPPSGGQTPPRNPQQGNTFNINSTETASAFEATIC